MPVTASALDPEVTYISGVAADGTTAPLSYWTWDTTNLAGITYKAMSGASKWQGGTAGTPGGTVAYAFDAGSAWTAAEMSAFQGAMALWSSVADIQFQQTDQASAKLVFKRDPTVSGAETGVYPHSEAVGTSILPDALTGSEVIVMQVNTNGVGFQHLDSFQDIGGYDIGSIVHEMGHVLGLGHGGPYSANVKNGLTKQSVQATPFDTNLWTVMSYVPSGDTTARFYDQYLYQAHWGLAAGGYARSATTPGMVDVLAAQRLYGASASGGLGGNQVFGFNTNLTGALAPYFDFTVNTNPIVTLFSTGTGNTLDLSGFAENSTVDLRPGTFSSVHGMVYNVGIALGVAIDAAVGGAGNDSFTLNTDGDTVDGGAGTDTVVLGRALGGTGHMRSGNALLLRDNQVTDRLTNIEQLQFTDGTLALGTDPLVDDVFYAEHYADVYHAGVAAGAHYAQSGWQEGRDPDAYFDTKAYLAVNPDVAAAAMNPLVHYDQFGWHEGRDPSAGFSTSLYLLRNPDVAAAGLDPLAHFLQFGQAEGRRAAPVVNSSQVQNGFDPGFYLLANPDVAAAGVNPLAHWQAYGEAEGRNPDGFFSTKGYLTTYPDVAAAGVDPLMHYLQTGWQEGRNPSTHFDTQAYLAHYPDVAAAAAAGITTPLTHFLQFGITEGRSGFGDNV